MTIALVARRNQLDDRDHPAKPVADRNAICLNGIRVGFDRADDPLDQGKTFRRQSTTIERIADLDRPRLMEVVKDAGVDSRPVVDGHSYPAAASAAPRLSQVAVNSSAIRTRLNASITDGRVPARISFRPDFFIAFRKLTIDPIPMLEIK